MYDWIWRRLPGPWWAKAVAAAGSVAAVVALLFLVVFPYAEPRLPWNRSVVTAPTGPMPPSAVPTSEGSP